MGSGRPWRRCSAGRSWIGWASQRAALTAAITAANVDDSTMFGAVLEDVPPIRPPSTTLAGRGTLVSRRSRPMVVTQSGTKRARSRSSPGGRRRARRTSSVQVPTISVTASSTDRGQPLLPSFSSAPRTEAHAGEVEAARAFARSVGRLPHVATWRTRTRAEPIVCGWHWPVLAGDHNPCWRAGSADRAAWADSAVINVGIDRGTDRRSRDAAGPAVAVFPIFAGLQRRADGCWPLGNLMVVPTVWWTRHRPARAGGG
jgi:hypothetical protein